MNPNKLFRAIIRLDAAIRAEEAYRASPEGQAALRAEAERAKAQHAEQVARAEQSEAEFEAQLDSPEFRQEVMDEIIAAGFTAAQAEGFTNTRARLHAQAIQYGLM